MASHNGKNRRAGWKRAEVGGAFVLKEDGESIEARRYLGTREGQHGLVHDFELEDGKVVSVGGRSQLDRALAQIRVGSPVYVERLGVRDIGKGQSVVDFLVEAPPEAYKTTDNRLESGEDAPVRGVAGAREVLRQAREGEPGDEGVPF